VWGEGGKKKERGKRGEGGKTKRRERERKEGRGEERDEYAPTVSAPRFTSKVEYSSINEKKTSSSSSKLSRHENTAQPHPL